jgi:hypothetical protein
MNICSVDPDMISSDLGPYVVLHQGEPSGGLYLVGQYTSLEEAIEAAAGAHCPNVLVKLVEIDAADRDESAVQHPQYIFSANPQQTLDALAEAQGVKPMMNVRETLFGSWPDREEVLAEARRSVWEKCRKIVGLMVPESVSPLGRDIEIRTCNRICDLFRKQERQDLGNADNDNDAG